MTQQGQEHRMPQLPNAACRDTDPTPALCERCWDRPECLAWALVHEDTGMWAGHNQHALRRMRGEFGIELKPITRFDMYLAGAK